MMVTPPIINNSQTMNDGQRIESKAKQAPGHTIIYISVASIEFSPLVENAILRYNTKEEDNLVCM